MVARQLQARDIADRRVLDAMGCVERERFVPPELADLAYADRALPIGSDQTISQPYMVALMAQAAALSPQDRVLEIGTGSGYAAAILATLAAHVFSVERHRDLADGAADRLRREGFANVDVRAGDGSLGWPERAPFDAIVVAAGGPSLPMPLRDQLSVGGRLVMPIGGGGGQVLTRVTRTGPDTFRRDDLGGVSFVPLVGRGGWDEI